MAPRERGRSFDMTIVRDNRNVCSITERPRPRLGPTNYPGQKKTATTIMHKIRTLFLSWDIEKSSLIALRCAAMREVAASRARDRANLLIMLILRDKNSVLILCIIVVVVFFCPG